MYTYNKECSKKMDHIKYSKKNIAPLFLTTACLYIERGPCSWSNISSCGELLIRYVTFAVDISLREVTPVKLRIIVLPVFCKFVADLLQILWLRSPTLIIDVKFFLLKYNSNNHNLISMIIRFIISFRHYQIDLPHEEAEFSISTK